MKRPIYMDNHATTPLDPRVLDAMMPYLTTAFGNAASRNHLFGWEAEAAVDEARGKVAALLGASPAEIVFTSGATESDNLAILGAARRYREKGTHVVTGATEHKAVLDACRELEAEGFEVTVLAPDRYGQIAAAQVEAALTDRTILVSLMLANNEIGTIHPLREIAAVCRARGILVHTDAVQGVGKIPFDVETFGVDLVSITGHKIYGPKGCGALYVRGKTPRVRLEPMIHGGGHERGLRSGTLNVPGIVGLGKACELAGAELPEESRRLRRLRQRLWEGISALDDLHVNGYPLPAIDADGDLLGPEWRIPGNLNVSFGGVEGEALIAGIRDVAVSSGAACTSASVEPSHVQKAIGVTDALAFSAVRFGLGRFNTEGEVDFTVGEVVRAVSELRAAHAG
ncbi:MAG TPA: aminotransferase class V-fold PLP-dependent enzyme [Thermoanaerobaculia bacterium]|nr:aminotransferase class V-fold PLP-dependent enzyme [Thermoanaerobaculia bacterium]